MRVKPYLVIGDIIVSTHSLNLHGTEHPTDIVDDLDIGRSSLDVIRKEAFHQE